MANIIIKYLTLYNIFFIDRLEVYIEPSNCLFEIV